MAPPTVLSYFSRGYHRRTGSSPQSPLSPQWHSAASFRGQDDSNQSPSGSSFSFKPSANPSPATDSPVSPLPPVLPPIRRVASAQEDGGQSHPPDSGANEVSSPDKKPDVESKPQASRPTLRVMTRKQPLQEPLQILTTSESKLETGYRRRHQPPISISEHRDSSASNEHAAIRGRSEARAGEESSPFQNESNFNSSVASHHKSSRPTTPPAMLHASDLQPPNSSASRRASSPASSFSSIPKSTYSSNAQLDSSPASSKSAAPPNNPSASSRVSKTKMNLLNPVSLLRRRRTAQGVDPVPDSSYIGRPNLDVPVMDLPADYDPRIKGKGVHDFNAPRPPRRHYSTNDAGLGIQISGDASPVEEYRRRSMVPPATQDNKDGSPLDKDPGHQVTPDKEHVPMFLEHFEDDADGQTNTSAVQRESLANASFLARMSRQLDFDSPDFNYFKGTTSSDKQESVTSPTPAGERTSKSTVEAPSLRVSSDHSTARSSISNETRATSPSASPSSKPQRGSLTLEPPFQSETVPRHHLSSASRTSRFSFQLNSEATLAQEKALEEKGKERAAAKARSPNTDDDSDFDSSEGNVSNFGDIDDDPYEEPIPMVNALGEEEDSGNDEVNEPSRGMAPPFHPYSNNNIPLSELSEGFDSADTALQNPEEQISLQSEDMDSLYYDDGMIEEPSPNFSKPFDESLLDSDLESFKDARSWTASPPQPATQPVAEPLHDSASTLLDTHSFEALNEYHDALAAAATKAEADGKFQRKFSTDTSALEPENKQVPHTSESSAFDPDLGQWFQPVFEDSDFDGLEDDPMVAAANAEVLASEDSDYYGREFGFYGGVGDEQSEMCNGGYFCSSADELNRSISGRNASREPNLTPITERSEFSTRNSFTSVRRWGSNQSLPNSAVSRGDIQQANPGLKELVANMGSDENDMNLSQLLKLRKETFGAHRRGGSGGGNSSIGSLASDSSLNWHTPLGSQVLVEEDIPDSSSLPAIQTTTYDQDTGWEQDSPSSPVSFPPLPMASLLAPLSSPGPSLKTPPFSNSSETTPKPLSAFKPNTSQLPYPVDDNGAMPPSPTPNTAPLPSTSTFKHEGSIAPHPAVDLKSRRFTLPMAALSEPSSPIIPKASPNLPLPIPLPGYHHHSKSAPLEMPMPVPPVAMMQKFAMRPPASSASYAERERYRHTQASSGRVGFKSNANSVAYVREDSQWYLERRRRLSSGELVVIGRELVEGGRI